MKKIFGKKDKESKTDESVEIDKSPTRNVLIIDSDSRSWSETFKGVRLQDGSKIHIEKSEWSGLVINADQQGKPIVNIKPNKRPIAGTNEDNFRTIQPDIVLVRQLVRGLTTDEDYTNVLYGFMFSDTPAVNSFESIWKGLERPVVHSELNKIAKKLGYDKFPLIPMSYYSHQQAMMFTPELPIIVKVGYAEAGYGKMKIDTQEQLNDLRSILALHKDYITAERFIAKREYDIRVQKIGSHLRAYKRINANWKGNVGTSHLEEIPVTDTFRLWADEVGKHFDMDILTVDAIHTPEGKDFILEINDTASGLAKTNEQEDMGYIRDLVVEKLNKIFPSQQ